MASLSNSLKCARVGIIGLGYVGLPLAVEFAKKRDVIGFDINCSRVEALRRGYDSTLEVSEEDLRAAARLRFTCELSDLAHSTVYIVTVPTPIDSHKRPDLSHLVKASHAVGKLLKPGNVVIYELTVYPGTTEEECVPILERASGLTYNVNFFVGYSPERVNPGDRLHRVANIIKVTSGSTSDTADFVDALYSEIITAGTYKVQSIKVAEAAKVIENT
jgi:UDP-N-acetyl-D-galactosamine dehydrogenase